MAQDTQQKLSQALSEFNQRSERGASPTRAAYQVGDIDINISGQHLDDEALQDLFVIADTADFARHRAALAAGEKINLSEDRAALHPALRAHEEDSLFGGPYKESVKAVLERMADWVGQLHRGEWRGATNRPIRHLVHIGIGGSHAGVELACEALSGDQRRHLAVHFVANLDGCALGRALASCQPEATLFVVASKSFTTKEVLINRQSARNWLLQRGINEERLDRHFICITADLEQAKDQGFTEDQCLAIPEWVGGRYSHWSAVGFSLAAKLGMVCFRELLDGARTIDEHFFTAGAADNVPLLLALIDIWNINALDIRTQLILPYAERLALLPTHLQQLQMESNGKSLSRTGEALHHRTSPILWGGVGTQAQHTFFQLLYQGTEQVAIDWILVRDAPPLELINHQPWLNSAAAGHATALSEQGADRIANPGTYMVLPALTPASLGQLLALYEHRVFCQALLWDVNAFDQPGVEQGKALTDEMHAVITGGKEPTERISAELAPLLRSQLKNPKSE